MNTTDLVHFPPADAPARRAGSRPAISPLRHELAAPVRSSILCGREYLCAEQRLDGSWSGATTGEISALCQLALLFAFLRRDDDVLVEQAARAILRQQGAEGGWARTPGGPFDLDWSVLAYFALKLVGEDACGAELAHARRAIREHGGADRCSNSTRCWLALLGQIDYELCLPSPPEWLLATALNQNATSREMLELAARSAVWALRPRRDVELRRGVRELFIEAPRDWPPPPRNASDSADRLSRFWSRCERVGIVPLRRRALERASFLLTEAAVEVSSVEFEFAEVVWQWIALSALGYRDSCRAVTACERRLRRMIAIDEVADEARSQPTTTLATDTSLALVALAASGLSREHPVLAAGVRWLVDHRQPLEGIGSSSADSSVLLAALTALDRGREAVGERLPPELRVADDGEIEFAAARADDVVPRVKIRQFIDKLVSGISVEQGPDGGWSVWDGVARLRAKGINHAMDRRCGSSAADLTGTTLEVLAGSRICVRAASERAIASLRATQRGNGSWDSDTHARYVYGTSCAVRGLIAGGVSAHDPAVARGVNWLLVHQDETGGWGEASGQLSGTTEFVAAEPTSIQTAWAVLALTAAGLADQDATRRGVNFLVGAQRDVGDWCDAQLVERDGPRGPWYQNNLHSTSWSLLALARWTVAIAASANEGTTRLRLVSDHLPHEIG